MGEDLSSLWQNAALVMGGSGTHDCDVVSFKHQILPTVDMAHASHYERLTDATPQIIGKESSCMFTQLGTFTYSA